MEEKMFFAGKEEDRMSLIEKENMSLTDHAIGVAGRTACHAQRVEGTEMKEDNVGFVFFAKRQKQNQRLLSVNSSELGERVRKKSAFTLIELLVVMVLMAIILGMAAPAFIGMGRGAGMRGGVRSVCSTLSLLRQWAITHSEEVSFVYFEGASGSESYYYATNEFGTAIISTNDPPTLPLDVIFGPDDGVGEPFKVTFKTDGGVAQIGSSTKHIYIWDRKFIDSGDTTKRKTISINGLTGGIRVE